MNKLFAIILKVSSSGLEKKVGNEKWTKECGGQWERKKRKKSFSISVSLDGTKKELAWRFLLFFDFLASLKLWKIFKKKKKHFFIIFLPLKFLTVFKYLNSKNTKAFPPSGVFHHNTTFFEKISFIFATLREWIAKIIYHLGAIYTYKIS